jgi:hypothetical protein
VPHVQEIIVHGRTFESVEAGLGGVEVALEDNAGLVAVEVGAVGEGAVVGGVGNGGVEVLDRAGRGVACVVEVCGAQAGVAIVAAVTGWVEVLVI